MIRRLQSERGHGGVTFGSTIVIIGVVLLAIGLGRDSNSMSVAGAIVLGLGTLLGINAPHIWMRSVYRRLDKVDPDDREATDKFKVQF